MSRIDDLREFYVTNSAVEWRSLDSIARRNKGFSVTAKLINEQKSNKEGILVFGAGNTKAYFNPKLVPENRTLKKECVIVKSRGYIDFEYCNIPCAHKSELWSYTCDSSLISTKFLYYFLKTLTESLQNHARATSVKIPQLSVGDTDSLMIPVPPLEVQDEIVRILDSFTNLEANLQAELEARCKQYEYYRDSLRDVNNQENRLGKKVELIALEETCNISAGGDAPKESMCKTKTDKYKVPIISNGIGENALYGYTDIAKINTPAVTIAARGTIGYAEYRDYPYFPIIRLLTAIPKDNSFLNVKYLYYCLQGKKYQLPNGGIPQLTAPQLKKVKIPVPPLTEQERIVAILDKFDALVNDLSSGLPAEIAARRKQYEHYRDRLLTFTPPQQFAHGKPVQSNCIITKIGVS